jgi:hypothetical protein
MAGTLENKTNAPLTSRPVKLKAGRFFSYHLEKESSIVGSNMESYIDQFLFS